VPPRPLPPSGAELDLCGRPVLVVGYGVSGRAAARALAAHGAIVTTVDEHAPDADRADPDVIDPTAFDLLLASPGWAPARSVLARAVSAGVPVWSEIELGWRVRAHRPAGPAPWLAVTGTNGKTTTVGMLESILLAAGLRARAVGNVGPTVVEAVVDPTVDVLAVELSSFQLHFTQSLAAQASACLNVASDHLDWHGSYAGYLADKGRIFERTQRACVFNVNDPATEALVRGADVEEGCVAIGFTAGAPRVGQLGVVDDVLVDRGLAPERQTHAVELATIADLGHLTGPDGRVPRHVVEDALAAAALALAHGVEPTHVRDGLRAYRSGAHRLTDVGRHAGVAFVDDSKATNAHAAEAALRSFGPHTVVWIAGGLAKGAEFDDLVERCADRLRAVVLIGVDRDPLRRALERHAAAIPVFEVDANDTEGVMTRAVVAARRFAVEGDTVLLAPACASMDQFVSYADRGDQFIAAVRRVTGPAD
jgi:UDP-N-acetylmuramoylalanine--D-glutamate ligase